MSVKRSHTRPTNRPVDEHTCMVLAFHKLMSLCLNGTEEFFTSLNIATLTKGALFGSNKPRSVDDLPLCPSQQFIRVGVDGLDPTNLRVLDLALQEGLRSPSQDALRKWAREQEWCHRIVFVCKMLDLSKASRIPVQAGLDFHRHHGGR